MLDSNTSQSNSQGREVIEHLLKDSSNAIRLCLNNKLPLQALSLIYATIDHLAFLDMPKDQIDVKGKDFKNWCNSYMLLEKNNPVDCTPDDLWGARCGLLHAYTPESKSSRNNNAKPILYAYRRSDITKEQCFLKQESPSWILVDIDKFFEVFLNGMVAFFEALDRDEQKRTIALDRARGMFAYQNNFWPP